MAYIACIIFIQKMLYKNHLHQIKSSQLIEIVRILLKEDTLPTSDESRSSVCPYYSALIVSSREIPVSAVFSTSGKARGLLAGSWELHSAAAADL